VITELKKLETRLGSAETVAWLCSQPALAPKISEVGRTVIAGKSPEGTCSGGKPLEIVSARTKFRFFEALLLFCLGGEPCWLPEDLGLLSDDDLEMNLKQAILQQAEVLRSEFPKFLAPYFAASQHWK
jgi:hypothetical protein